MATGPEHYLKAEQLIDMAEHDRDLTNPERSRITAGSHVHATLALAATTALSRFAEMPVSDCDAWLKAASREPPR